MPDDTTAPADLCWLCQDLGGIAVHVHWSAQRGKPLWTAHAPTSVSHPVRPCPACRPAAPVAAEGLRERLTDVATEWALMYPLANWPCLGRGFDEGGQLDAIALSIASVWGRDIADRVLADLAQLLDPGDLPDRMKAAIEDAECPHEEHEFDPCSTCRAAAAMSVRWEDHAATVAKLDHALAELSALRDHRACWETENARADKAEAQVAAISTLITENYGEHYGDEDVPAAVERLMRHLSEHEADVLRLRQAKNDALERAEAEVERLRAELANERKKLRFAMDAAGELDRQGKQAEAERDALKAAIEDVRRLHRPMAIYSGDAGCLEDAECAEEQDYPEGEESAIGGFCPHTIKDATICPACSQMDFDTDSWPQDRWVLYPCPTIAALASPSPVSAATGETDTAEEAR